MIRRPTGHLGIDPTEPSLGKIEFIDKGVDHPNGIVLANPVFQAFAIAAPSAFCDTVPDGETSGTRSSNRSPCAKISVIMPPPCAQTPVEVLVLGLLPPFSG
jgi:hypothetical protein